jgi:hypothetical protein
MNCYHCHQRHALTGLLMLLLLGAGSGRAQDSAGGERDATVPSAIAKIESVAIDSPDESKWPPAVEGMGLLADRFFLDPRAEKKLDAIAKRAEIVPRIGPQITLQSIAWDHLIRLRANKLYATWMAGLDTPALRLTRTRKLLAEHKDLLNQPPQTDADLTTKLAVEIAVKRSLQQSGAQAIDIAMFRPVAIDATYAKAHSTTLIQNLAALPYEQAITQIVLVQKLEETKDASLAPVIVKWFGQADGDGQWLWLTELIDDLPDGRSHLLGLLEHERPPVVAYAAFRLGLRFPDAEVLIALKKQQQHIQQSNANEKYKNLLAGAIQRTQAHLGAEAGRENLLTQIASPINKTHLFADVTELIRSYPDRVTLDRLIKTSRQFERAGSKTYAEIINQRIELILKPKLDQVD